MSQGEPRVGDVVVARIDTLDDEGRGRASMPRDAEHAIELCVRGAFIGDVVEAEIERVFPASGVAQARALRVIERGPQHAPRSCPHASPCPGCPLHGIEPHAALDLKVARIAHALADAGLRARIADVRERRAPRQKVKLVVADGRVGLYVPHTHALADADRCPNHDPLVERALVKLRPLLVAEAAVKAVIVRAFAEGAGVVLVCHPAPRADVVRAFAALVDDAPIASLAVRVDDSGSNSLLGGDVRHAYGAALLTPLDGGPPSTVDAFCQPDPVLAAQLNDEVARALTAKSAAGVFADLYAGTGAFSRALLGHGAAHVVAVERADTSTPMLSHLRGVTAIGKRVEDALVELFEHHRKTPFSGLVADPPRKGLAGAAKPLVALEVPQVALVACDPDAGARDARVFVDAGYTLSSVTPYDLFPDTPDVETVFLLSRATRERGLKDSS